MNCPSCDVEMADLVEEEQRVRACSECGGLWLDTADLNQLLLHNNLPGLGSLGGRIDPAASTPTCRDCMIDLTRIDLGARHDAQYYESCESCAGVFIEGEPPAPTDLKGAQAQLVGFFRSLELKKLAAK